MFTWISHYIKQGKSDTPIHRESFYLKKIQSNHPESMTELATFFIAGSMIVSEEMMVSLPVRYKESETIILEEMAVHFEDVKLVYRNDQLTNINMRLPKRESKALFNISSSETKKMMFDFYRTSELNNWSTPHKRSISHYRILTREIERQEIQSTEKLKQYILREYIRTNESLCLIPSGWNFQDNLKNSLILRFLSSFVPVINIGVDNGKNDVVFIELCNGFWE
jgi:hypothetical protein